MRPVTNPEAAPATPGMAHPAADIALLRALSWLPDSWIIVPDVELPPARPGQPPDRLPAALLHRDFGVVLLEFEPADTADAAHRFRRRLRAAGLALESLPVLHLTMPRARADRLGQALEHVLAQQRGAGMADRSWVRTVVQLLDRRPPGAAAPQRSPAAAPPPSPAAAPRQPRPRRGAWLAALAFAGAGAAAVYGLAIRGGAPQPDEPRAGAVAVAPESPAEAAQAIGAIAPPRPAEAEPIPPPGPDPGPLPSPEPLAQVADAASDAERAMATPAAADPGQPGLVPDPPDVAPVAAAPDQADMAEPGLAASPPAPLEPAPLEPAPLEPPAVAPEPGPAQPVDAEPPATPLPSPDAPLASPPAGDPADQAEAPAPEPPVPLAAAPPTTAPEVTPPTGQQPAPAMPIAPAADTAPPPSGPQPAPDAAQAPRGAPLAPALLAALIRRGDQMLALGDISAARLLYERAAAAGSGAAALAAGRAYDPAILARLGAQGMRADPQVAAAWYRRALALGEAEAAVLLDALPGGGGDGQAQDREGGGR